ncbi:hypothetical protein [Vibrio maritimus]|uniref:hypothetical protein n=1 Tax=Vibrio maritimus TaxID=990268 RepID=UPI001F1E4EB1|nr:hypothetical protein [Vibrio maritimus]
MRSNGMFTDTRKRLSRHIKEAGMLEMTQEQEDVGRNWLISTPDALTESGERVGDIIPTEIWCEGSTPLATDWR